MKHIVIALCMLVLLFLSTVTMAAQENVAFVSNAEVEIQETNSKGENIWVRKPPTLVVPGTIVIYTNSFTNNGKEPATNLVVTNPIPENMVYVTGSALGNDTEITFSADGAKTFVPEDQLQVTDPDGTRRPAAPKDITHVRWRVIKPLPPTNSGYVEFRVRLL